MERLEIGETERFFYYTCRSVFIEIVREAGGRYYGRLEDMLFFSRVLLFFLDRVGRCDFWSGLGFSFVAVGVSWLGGIG